MADTFHVKIMWVDDEGNEQVFETVADQEILTGEILIK
jgi:hypothetical protein